MNRKQAKKIYPEKKTDYVTREEFLHFKNTRIEDGRNQVPPNPAQRETANSMLYAVNGCNSPPSLLTTNIALFKGMKEAQYDMLDSLSIIEQNLMVLGDIIFGVRLTSSPVNSIGGTKELGPKEGCIQDQIMEGNSNIRTKISNIQNEVRRLEQLV